jgi:hypothetical protein
MSRPALPGLLLSRRNARRDHLQVSVLEDIVVTARLCHGHSEAHSLGDQGA